MWIIAKYVNGCIRIRKRKKQRDLAGWECVCACVCDVVCRLFKGKHANLHLTRCSGWKRPQKRELTGNKSLGSYQNLLLGRAMHSVWVRGECVQKAEVMLASFTLLRPCTFLGGTSGRSKHVRSDRSRYRRSVEGRVDVQMR